VAEGDIMIQHPMYKFEEIRLLNRIRAAYILGYILSGITFAVVLLNELSSAYMLDGILAATCATLMWVKQSRAAATVLFSMQAISRVLVFFDPTRSTGTPFYVIVSILFLWILGQGMVATYKLHKLRTQTVTEVTAEVIREEGKV
jgi:hypothetical protein